MKNGLSQHAMRDQYNSARTAAALGRAGGRVVHAIVLTM
jgi:hypothetical protein